MMIRREKVREKHYFSLDFFDLLFLHTIYSSLATGQGKQAVLIAIAMNKHSDL